MAARRARSAGRRGGGAPGSRPGALRRGLLVRWGCAPSAQGQPIASLAVLRIVRISVLFRMFSTYLPGLILKCEVCPPSPPPPKSRLALGVAYRIF